MPPEPAARATTFRQAITVAALLSAAVLLSWHPLEDLDIWFHLRAGHDLVDSGPLPPLNQYSFTEPRHPWLNHEWLFQLLTRVSAPRAPLTAMDVGGWNVLRTLLGGVVLLLLALGDGGVQRLRGRGSPLGAAWSGPVLLGALGLMWPRLMLRPELLSFAAIVLLVRWTEALRRRLDAGDLVPLRPRALADPRSPAGRIVWLTWIWAQCHGFSAAAPIVVAAGLLLPEIGSTPSRPSARACRAVPGLMGVLLVCLLATPNAWQGLVFPLRALGQFRGDGADLRRNIAELVPLLRTTGTLATTILMFQASLVAGSALVLVAWRRIGALRIALWLAMAAATFASQRALGPYGVAFALVGLRAGLPDRWRQIIDRSPSRSAAVANAGVFVTLTVAAWWMGGVVSDRFYLSEGVARRFGAGAAAAQYPVAAAAHLEKTPQARVFANLGASGLLLGTTRVTLFIDGRTEAYSAALWREYFDIRGAGDHALALLDARRVDAVCLAAPAGVFAELARDLVASSRWNLASAEGAGLLFVRERLEPGPDHAPHLAMAKHEVLTRAAASGRQLAGRPRLSPARAADELLAAANLYLLAGDDIGRRACLEEAVRRSPRHALAQYNFGNLLLAEGRPADALERFLVAVSANRRLSEPRLNGGQCLMKLNRATEAVRWFAQATRLDSRSTGAWANLAIARHATGDRAGALSAIDRALALSPADARLAALRDTLRKPTAPQ